MRVVLTLLLAFAASSSFTRSIPVGSPSSSMQSADELAERVRLADQEYAEALAAITRPDRGYRAYIDALAKAHPHPPGTTSLRKPSRAELADLGDRYYDTLPEVVRMGYLERRKGFVGQTPNGRLIFEAPHIQGITLNIPDKSHVFTELLIAANEKVHHYGWSQMKGYGPETLRDIAIILGEKRFLLKDNVPINRWGVTRLHPDESEWFRSLDQGNETKGKGLIKLGEPMELSEWKDT